MSETELYELVVNLTETLRELYDYQNGIPFLKHEKEWRAAMKRSAEILKFAEFFIKVESGNMGIKDA